MNANDHPQSNNRRILLIDDNADVLTVIKLSLEMLGYEVTECSNGRDAIKQFPALRPAIAIIDQGLPDIRGLDIGRRLRELKSGKSCPMILLTGTDCQKLRDQASEAGFSDFLVKPVRINALSDCIKQQLELS